MTAPNLLNDDGSASMATILMMSHHGFRRDIKRFARALHELAGRDRSRLDALRDEWQSYHATLHGHHEMEDTRLFPHLRQMSETLARVIDELSAEHRRIDPLLARGDEAFAHLPNVEAATALVGELTELLEPHLAKEEAEVIPLIRGAKDFPLPRSDEEAELYAQGFAWSSHGIAAEVLEKVHAVLPGNLRSKLPAARAAFEARCERVWGSADAGASLTAVPDR
jgi:hemerythrin-like domain-containing protein